MDLQSPDPRDRTSAAHHLRSGGGVPPEAVPALFQAIQVEQNKKLVRLHKMVGEDKVIVEACKLYPL